MTHPMPDTIATRMLLALVLGLAISHALSLVFYVSDRHEVALHGHDEQMGERIAAIVRVVDEASPNDRERLIRVAEDTGLHVVLSAESFLGDPPDVAQRAGALIDTLVASISEDGHVPYGYLHTDGVLPAPWQEHLTTSGDEGQITETALVSVPLSDGNWLNFSARVRTPDPILSLRFVLSMGVMLLAVVTLSALVVRHLTGPYRSFATAAKQLGTDVKSPPLRETGPAEVREATRAFNEMHDRIRHFVEDRTQMIAAISHDLGTPVTRLRLRAEFVDDEEQRQKMVQDLDDIEKMVASALSFARDDAAVEPRATVDLRTLLQRVCDDASDAGQDVGANTGDVAVPYSCRPAALRRALTNLIDNAVKYGKRATVSLEDSADRATISIEDEGPGIPGNMQEEAFRPFRRLDTSRSREHGGAGLGLTVAKTIVLAHGGEVELTNRDEGGLRVEVRLPH